MRQLIKKLLYPQQDLNQPFGAAELVAQQQLASELGSHVVFDSKRDQFFAIYSLNLLNSELKIIVKDSAHLIYPDVCNLSSRIVYARCQSLDRNAASTVWIIDQERRATQLAENGTFPTFNSLGDKVYFERGRKQLWSVDSDGANETLVFAGAKTDFGDYALVKPRVSADQKHVIFTSDKDGRWNLWCLNLENSSFHHVAKGCEAAWYPDNRNTAWIKKYGWLDLVGIYGIDALTPGNPVCIQDSKSGLGHEYFPYITPDGRYLLYSACPIYQHDHNSANYQLFAKNLLSGHVTRLTFDSYTNRWPKVLKVQV